MKKTAQELEKRAKQLSVAVTLMNKENAGAKLTFAERNIINISMKRKPIA